MKLKRLTAFAVVPTLALSSCQTTNPYTGEQQTSRSAIGAGIGALAGGLLGSATGEGSTDRRQRAMIGAGIGALAGGGIGNYMDRQQAVLRDELRGTGVSVTRSGNDLLLNMPGDITFATGSSRISGEFYPVLNSVAKVLAKYDKTLVDVIGHTDNVGERNYNFRLSESRAESVAGYLRSRGVVSQRLLTTGFGPDQPIASNSSASGREQNRRVTIQLRPLQQ